MHTLEIDFEFSSIYRVQKIFVKSMGIKKVNYLGQFTPGLQRSDWEMCYSHFTSKISRTIPRFLEIWITGRNTKIEVLQPNMVKYVDLSKVRGTPCNRKIKWSEASTKGQHLSVSGFFDPIPELKAALG